MKTLFNLLFCATLLLTISSCENQVSENHLALENVAAQVEANIKLYENVWDKARAQGLEKGLGKRLPDRHPTWQL